MIFCIINDALINIVLLLQKIYSLGDKRIKLDYFGTQKQMKILNKLHYKII